MAFDSVNKKSSLRNNLILGVCSTVSYFNVYMKIDGKKNYISNTVKVWSLWSDILFERTQESIYGHLFLLTEPI